MRVRVPADTDRPDRILAGLTARQLAILGTAGLGAWTLLVTAQRALPLPLAAALAAPVALAGLALAVGARDGVGLDQLALAWLRFARGPRRLVPAPEGAPALPAGSGRGQPAPLRLPVRALTPDGVIDLGVQGAALACRATSVNFSLRTEAEQQALVAGLARFLRSVTAPVQLVVRAERADPGELAAQLAAGGEARTPAAVAAAAREHAGWLGELAQRRDVLGREVLVVFRTTDRLPGAAAGLLRRAEQAAGLLAGCGVALTVLDGPAAARLLTRALDPEAAPLPAGLAGWGTVITGPHPRGPHPQPASAAVPPMPEAVEVAPRWLRAGAALCRTLAVVGYPPEVGAGWLEPLVTHSGTIDAALHVEPIPAAEAADRLRRQLARLESSRRLDADQGRLPDFEVDAAAEDARELARRLARGERLYKVGLYVTVRARDEQELDAETERVRALLGSLLLVAYPATFRMLHGWLTTLPLGLDLLRLRRTMDTQALAAGFPFASAELPNPGGVLYGRNTRSGGLVLWDRFAQPNYNSVILARSGAGKSYLAKLELLRWLYQGVEAFVIDPEGEYRRLAEAVGGAYLVLGAAGAGLNPLDLAPEPDALTRRALFCHTLVGVLLGAPLDPAARAALDRAVIAAYRARGITHDPRTHARPAPVLGDLAAALEADADPAARQLAGRLAPYVTGTHRHLLAGPTATKPEGHLVVLSLRALPEELKAAGTLLALDTVWRQVTNPAARRRRLVVVDEAWLLARDPVGARYLYRLAKSARKHWCGLTCVTQDAADLLSTELGQAVVANAATQVLLGQAPQAVAPLARACRLSEGEQQLLLAAQVGEGILAAGSGQRVAFRSLASPAEHALVTTDPAELAGQEAHR